MRAFIAGKEDFEHFILILKKNATNVNFETDLNLDFLMRECANFELVLAIKLSAISSSSE
jgi:hypothetical protein